MESGKPSTASGKLEGVLDSTHTRQRLERETQNVNFKVQQRNTAPSVGDEATDLVQPSGAKRSAKMPYYSAIPRQSLRRLALRATGAPRGEALRDVETGFVQEGGSDKYGYGNWAKGLEFEDTFNHVIDHLYRWKESVESGEASTDDDLAGAAWGILLPLMKFEADYRHQFAQRKAFIAQAKATGLLDSAEHIDHLMREHGYTLLKPLSSVAKQ